MDNIDTYMQRRIWDTEMEVLDVIDKVCRENGLKYSLAYGSMIGVVRHGGFIPWDDDMDIWMLREDYEKFIGIWENNPVDGYFLLRQETSPEYPQNFAKIRKCNTAFVSAGEENTNYHHGIFVDIFFKTYFNKCTYFFDLPSSSPPTRFCVKKRLIQQKRMWPCLEIVL